MKLKHLLIAGLAVMSWSVVSVALEEDHRTTPSENVHSEAAHHAHHKIEAHKHHAEARHAKWKAKWEKMTPEQKTRWKERHEKWKSMSQEERTKMKAAHKRMMKHLDEEATKTEGSTNTITSETSAATN